jgi:hypothetical protein
MTDNPQVNQPSPTALLTAQTQSLADLVEIQKAQSAQIQALQQQNERLISIQVEAKREPAAGRVKIENINMPFWAMVGFLIKLSLASIPAMIIFSIIFTLIALVLGGVLGGVFGALFGAFR